MNVFGTLITALGAVVLLVASIGLFRLRGALSRQHAATKAGSLGIVIAMLGTAASVGQTDWWIRAGVIIAVVWATLPVASHVLARAAYRPAANSDTRESGNRDIAVPPER